VARAEIRKLCGPYLGREWKTDPPRGVRGFLGHGGIALNTVPSNLLKKDKGVNQIVRRAYALSRWRASSSSRQGFRTLFAAFTPASKKYADRTPDSANVLPAS